MPEATHLPDGAAERPAVDVLAQAAEMLATLDVATAGDDALLDLAALAAAARRVADGLLVQLADRLESNTVVHEAGWGGAKEYLTHLLGGRKGAGTAYTRVAARTREFPALREALAGGAVSIDQARVITDHATRLPHAPTSTGTLRADAVQQLIGLATAGGRDATDLKQAFPDVVHDLDPDGALLANDLAKPAKERAAYAQRFLAFAPDVHGGVRITGYATIEEAELVKTTLLPLAAPQPTPPGACGGDPTLVGKRDAHFVPLDPGCPTKHLPGSALGGCNHSGRDAREHGTRMWDALVEACTRLAATDALPQTHGTSARIAVTIPLESLRASLDVGRAGEGAGLLPSGESLSAHAVRRLACDAAVIPTVLGTQNEILDVGRTNRLVTPALWNSLVIRDRHCTFPGCTRLPIACDAHHLVHWADGGVTSLDNLALLCRRHHVLTHHSPWTIRLDPYSRRPVWIPPPPPDPADYRRHISVHIPADSPSTFTAPPGVGPPREVASVG